MTLGENIRVCRQNAGMSQEKVAELVGVSRQAVTKWEAGQSVPNTENLFKLAEIFGTTVDRLLASGENGPPSPAEPIVRRRSMEEDKSAARKKQTQKRNIRMALLIAAGYIVLYLIGRLVWCDRSQGTLIGWLFTTRPSGAHSYLYGWLLSSHLFWYAAAISVIPSLFGKYKFSGTTLIGFVIGAAAGMIFGPYPEGAAIGSGHYGWAIWGMTYLIAMAAGILVERFQQKSGGQPAEQPAHPIR